MRVLVFGGKTGQVANCLARLSDETMRIEMVSRDQVDFKVSGQVRDKVQATHADVIINAVAYTEVDKAESEFYLSNSINNLALHEMGGAAMERNIPVVHISTDYVFSGDGTAAWGPDDLTEPLGVYGATKLQGEMALKKVGGRHAIIRTSRVFSEFGNNFVKTMLRLSQEGRPIRVVDDQFGGPTGAEDIAQTALKLARSYVTETMDSKIYHYSGAPDCSWAQFAQEIFSLAGLETRVTPISSQNFETVARRPKNATLNCDLIEKDFGITRPDWRKALAKVLRRSGAAA